MKSFSRIKHKISNNRVTSRVTIACLTSTFMDVIFTVKYGDSITNVLWTAIFSLSIFVPSLYGAKLIDGNMFSIAGYFKGDLIFSLFGTIILILYIHRLDISYSSVTTGATLVLGYILVSAITFLTILVVSSIILAVAYLTKD